MSTVCDTLQQVTNNLQEIDYLQGRYLKQYFVYRREATKEYQVESDNFAKKMNAEKAPLTVQEIRNQAKKRIQMMLHQNKRPLDTTCLNL